MAVLNNIDNPLNTDKLVSAAHYVKYFILSSTLDRPGGTVAKNMNPRETAHCLIPLFNCVILSK